RGAGGDAREKNRSRRGEDAGDILRRSAGAAEKGDQSGRHDAGRDYVDGGARLATDRRGCDQGSGEARQGTRAVNAFPEYQQNAGASRNDVMNRRMLDAALLIARVPLGLFFFRAGWMKIFGMGISGFVKMTSGTIPP